MIKAPPWKALAPWLLAGVLIGLVVWFNHQATRVVTSDYLQLEGDAKDILALDTRVNLDALRLRERQLLNYDSLTQASRNITEVLGKLEGGFQTPGLRPVYQRLTEAWDHKQAYLEDFKRYNAVFVTAHEHFVNLASRLSAADSQLSLPDQGGSIARFTQDILVFVDGRATAVPAELSRRCKALPQLAEKQNPKTHAILGAMGRHCELLLGYQPQAQYYLDRVLDPTFSEKIHQAHQTLEANYEAQTREARIYHQLTVLLTVILIAWVATILRRLQSSTQALRQSHALLDNIADHLGEGIVAFDPEGLLQFSNRRAETMLGLGPDTTGCHAQTLLVEDNPEQPTHALHDAIAHRRHFEGECWLRRQDGTHFPAAVLGGPLPLPNQQTGFVASLRDITELRSAEARVVLAGQVFENLTEAMTITGPDGRIQSVNPAFSQVTGYSEQEAIGHKPGELLASGKHGPEFYQEMWETLSRTGKWQGEIVNRRKDGSTYPEWLSIAAVRNPEGQISHYIGLFSDITKRKEAEAHIHHLAYHDALTGLPNRLLFHDRLGQAIAHAQRSQRMLAVMMLDLDRFKSVNDSLGHNVGDQLLVEIAHRLTATLRAGDTLARLGGDEFALIMPEVRSHADAATLATKMIKQFEESVRLEGHDFFASTSIGIALYPTDGQSAHTLLRNADRALYAAKDAGRSVFRFFVADKAQDALAALEMESALRQALARQQIHLHYQLQVDSRTGNVAGVEALMRWTHPTYGAVPPDRFIPLAESLGIIEQLGSWALRTACRQIVSWWSEGLDIPRVAVNVSAMQLRLPDFVDQVIAIIQQEGLPPEVLELELTETMLSTDIEAGFAAFARLREQGIRVAIDDFGTGYSSLSYLCTYPVDVVKIDRSFVRGLETDPDQEYVVRAIILLAQSLGMRTIAEGVETEGQRNMLLALGCDEFQGYLLAHPGPPDSIGAKIQQLPAHTAR